MKRLFVAVELEQTVIDAAARLVSELRQRSAQLAPRARITWTVPARMHLTLSFIGDSTEEQADAIAATLDGGLPPAFDAEIAGLGVFPPQGAPRVLWAGVQSGAAALVALQKQVVERLAGVGVEPEERSYSPHLTLGRVREPAGLRAATLFEGLADTRLGRTRVREITLFESLLSPQGSTYVALHRATLDARGAHG